MGKKTMLNRNLVHISMAGFAILIGRVPPWAIVLLCFAALIFNLYILPRLSKGSLEKPEDGERGYSIGLLTYPAILFIISIIFYDHQVFLAIGWGMMAFGDGFASIVGRRLGSLKWYGGPKSVQGSITFFVAASIFTLALLWILPEDTSSILQWNEWYLIIPIVAFVAAIIEMTPGFFDDNLSVPLIGSLLAYGLWLIVQQGIFLLPPVLWPGIVVVAVFGIASYLSSAIDLKGSIAGVIIAMSIWLGGAFEALLLLFLFFVIGSAVAFVGRKAKLETGSKDFQKTKRGWRNAVANAGVAGAAGLMAWTVPEYETLFLVALAASLAAATSDTVSSEIGTAFGKSFYDLRSRKLSVPGVDGVVSSIGTLSGLIASGFIAVASYLLIPDMLAVTIIFVAGFAGNLIDSILGAGLQRAGFMNNHSVNMSSTLLAAMLASLMFYGAGVLL